jgi:hypothetical protein
MKEDTVMQNRDETKYKYVFVCGLQPSGTSMIGRNIARLENCTGFKDTGVIEDEGQYLQDVYPTGQAYGGPGKFGFDPRAPLLTAENALKLRRAGNATGSKAKLSAWKRRRAIF